MKKEDEIKSLSEKLKKAQDTIVSLQGDIEAYKTSGEQMGQEITSLKRQIGGFKTSNERYKKQATNDALYVKSLQQDLSKCKKEAQDEVSGLHDTINEKDKVIVGLQNQAQEMSTRIKNMEASLGEVMQDRDMYKANYEYFLSLPWYKRIFAK